MKARILRTPYTGERGEAVVVGGVYEYTMPEGDDVFYPFYIDGLPFARDEVELMDDETK